MGSQRWMAIGAVAIAAVVAVAAYNLGLEQGAAHAAVASGAASDAYEWGWHRHWGGGFPFGIFILMWFSLALVRGVFWGGPWYRRRWHYYGDDDSRRFDERHRRAHDRMAEETRPPT